MKYSYNWLKELSDTKLSPEKMAELLTMHSFEVEGVEKNNINLAGVVVGEILEITKHPNADRLQVAKVTVGNEELQIVCGAPNIAVGQKVPVATVGTTANPSSVASLLASNAMPRARTSSIMLSASTIGTPASEIGRAHV